MSGGSSGCSARNASSEGRSAANSNSSAAQAAQQLLVRGGADRDDRLGADAARRPRSPGSRPCSTRAARAARRQQLRDRGEVVEHAGVERALALAVAAQVEARRPPGRRRAPRARSRGGSPCASSRRGSRRGRPTAPRPDATACRRGRRAYFAPDHGRRDRQRLPPGLVGPRLAPARSGAATRSSSRASSARRRTSSPRTTCAPARGRRCRALAEHHDGPGDVLFASKAFPCTAVLRVFAEEGLGCDVASGGELDLALHAGFDPQRIVVHGNAKAHAELAAAVDVGVRYVVIDGYDDLERLEGIVPAGERQDVLRARHAGRRVRHPPRDRHRPPRLEVRRAAGAGARRCSNASAPRIASTLAGVHMHVGSQLLDVEPDARRRRRAGHAEPLRRLRPRRRPRRRLRARGPPAGDRGVGASPPPARCAS